MSARRWLGMASFACAIGGVAALGYCASVWIGATLYQSREAHWFAEEARSGKVAARPPETPRAPIAVEDGGLLGILEIPRIGLNVMVVEGVGRGDLARAVGHIPGTALPGQGGNVGLAGHRDTFFRPLRQIRPDDTITLRTVNGEYRYRVLDTKVVAPEDVKVLDPTGRDTLTLVTCFPFYYIGSAPKRFIVQAERSPQA
jgi:sortase A